MTKPENIISFPDLKIIEDEAAAWVARMANRALSADEYSRFQKWAGQSSQHREAVDRISDIWCGCDILDELNYVNHEAEFTDEIFETRRKIIWTVGAIAATMLLAFVAIYYQMGGYFDQSQTGSFITAIGSQKTIHLSDGSTAILNTNSKIDVNITQKSRTIKLIRGEVYFEVASDRYRPFNVYVGNGVVKAVGTAFTVYLHKEAVEVTVTKGIVELLVQDTGLSDAQLTVPDKVAAPKLTTIATITAGQNALFAEKVESLEHMSSEELDRKLLWRDGLIVFNGEPLSDVVADISRYTNIAIEIDDPDLNNILIGGHFKVGDVEGMFEALENIFDIQVNRVSAFHVKLSRALKLKK